MHPLEVFPIVVWEELLKRVGDYADRVAIARSHPALEKVFENECKEWHLAAVIPIMIKTLNTQRLPSVKPHFLPLRFVSKFISNEVEKSIKSRWDNCAHVPINLSIHYRNGDFLYGLNVHRFLHKFGDHPPNRSPLVNPFMRFEVPFANSAGSNMTDEERIQIVRKAGPHLKGLCLELRMFGRVDIIERTRYLLELTLSLTPNLVQLSFPGDRFSFDDNDAIIPELQSTPQLNLPDLPFLRYIRIGHKMHPLQKDFLGLEKYFAKLTRLSLMWNHWKEEYSSNSADLFPNLEYLHIWTKGYQYLYSSKIAQFRKNLLNMYKIQAPKIKEFYLQVNHSDRDILKRIVHVEARKGLKYLRERFEGECNWECKTKREGPDYWDVTLSRTNELDADDGDFPEGDLEEHVVEALIQEDDFTARMQKIEQELAIIKSELRFCSSTAILCAGILFAETVKSPFAFSIPILLAAGLSNIDFLELAGLS